MMRLLLNNVGGLKRFCSSPKLPLTSIRKSHIAAQNAERSNSEVYAEGDCIEGFIVKRRYDVPDLFLKCIELEHLKSGAEYLHLQREDSNNVFGIGFKTIPFDSSGVAHILEHLVLCGSEKYPCRDPFMKMLNRSQATYINAFTGPDYTFYPFSTMNNSDYKNLMSVYLDAVFRPKLRNLDFLQEGWRLENETIDDPNSPIIFKGVVFNEMKGAFSENVNVFYMNVLNNLMPSHTYGVVSGGDPLKIPSLTYDNLKRFYSDYYHPSNARFYSYGNFPLRHNLRFINEEYLSKVDKVESKKSEVPSESRWLEPKRKHIYCQKDVMADPEKQSYIDISHACCDITDIQECFVLELVSTLLLDGPNSALYKSLVEPGIASGFNPVTGFTNFTKTTALNVALQGLNDKDFDWAINTFDKSIEEVIEKGFDQRQLEGILHNIELSIKHQSEDFGIKMLTFVNSVWNHGGSVRTLLNVNDRLTSLKKDMTDDSKYLQKIVEKYLKNNSHRLILTMSPKENFDSILQQEESDLLKTKIESLEEKDIEAMRSTNLLLKDHQDKKDDVSVLPTLTMADINKEIERVDLKNITLSGVPVQMSLQPTNGLVYVRGLINAHHLSDECKLMLPLFCHVATEMGTASKDYREMDLLIKSVSESFNFSHNIVESLNNVRGFEESVMFSSFCLNRNLEEMLSLWLGLFHYMAVDQAERFKTLVTILAADCLNGIADQGHAYSMNLASSLVSPAFQRKELSSGITYVKKLQEIAQSDPEESLHFIRIISSQLLNKERLRTALNFSPPDEDNVLKHHSSFCDALSGSFRESNYETFDSLIADSSNKGVHHVIPFQIGYAAKSCVTVPFEHSDFAPLRVLCQLLSAKYLLPVVREKGGAYGSGCRITNGGVINFFSYKDPNPVQSLDVFDQSLTWLMKKEFSKNDIQEAKLGVFKSLDLPVPPGNKGLSAFISGLSDDKLQRHRTSLINVSEEDVMRAAQKYLNLDSNLPEGRAVIGPLNKNVLKRSNESWQIIE
ncbi:presequence protease, mitochondrial [Nilaparvata lugens]|uniref:presequence protease, mitochondrial n=1 Tax=Nilaparvata lugens TaxID=108931 RepID=UPI00193E3CEE|nr:presequence protease, mitochondrial [Nilaparvata lugens]XP_022201811.2 presequence protease, mitochondrial [Nilaparvata lugens]